MQIALAPDSMLKKRIVPLIFFAVILLVLLSSCASERFVPPALSDGPRADRDLKIAVLATVSDARTEPQPKDAAAELQADLTRIYGSTFEWGGTASPAPPGRVSVRITIRTLGAFYGKRLLSVKEYTERLSASHEKATTTWEPVLASASGQQSVLAAIVPAEGWWNGLAWIDLEIEDSRGPTPVGFILPLAAEHREAGRGRASGDQAALTAWQRASSRLLAAPDAVVLVMKQDER